MPGPGTILTSTTTAGALLLRESAGPDTFDLYGGPARPLRDPSQGQTVALDLVFNHETEPDFDFFRVEYDSAGI